MVIVRNNHEVAEVLMTRRTIEEYTGGVVKAATLAWWDHEGAGRGPKSFRIGGRKIVYRKSDVDAWLEAQYNAEAV